MSVEPLDGSLQHLSLKLVLAFSAVSVGLSIASGARVGRAGRLVCGELGIRDARMGKGPALALLLSGPALSLPAMLVLAGMMGWRKTLTYVGLVAVAATIAGMIFGAIA